MKSEYTANLHLGGQIKGSGKPFHLVKDGRTISKHSTNKEALKAYIGLGANLNKGVKIVQNEEVIVEAPAKITKVADKLIKLSKKNMKGNKHVNTKPELNQDKNIRVSSIDIPAEQENAKL